MVKHKKHMVLTLVAMLFVWMASPVHLKAADPTVDKTYRMVAGAGYNFIDINVTGTDLELGDDETAEISIPFEFKFYDSNYTSAYVNSNGTLSFTDDNPEYDQEEIPTSYFPDLIAVLWTDLDPTEGGSVLWEVKGNAPYRKLIIQWNNVYMCCYDEEDEDEDEEWPPAPSSVTFQVILYEGSSDILMQYKDVDFGEEFYNNGAHATVGIQKDDATGLQYSYNTPALKNNFAILFTQNPVVMAPIYYLLQ
jgi:hypothetical protein